MARSLGKVRLRWIIVLLAAGVLVVLSDVLFTWRQLTTSSSSTHQSVRGTARPATMQAIYDAVARANDSADVKSTQYGDRLSESEAAELLRKIDFNKPSVQPSALETIAGDDHVKVGTKKVETENRMKRLETQLLYTLNNVTQRTSEKRGIVLPLFDDLVPMGLSLLLELRSLGVVLPVEIPHCGDLDQKLVKTIEKKNRQLGHVFVYDVCELAAKEKSLLDSSKSLFCKDLDECHRKFRSFDIKVLGMIYSRFEEVLLVEANTLMMQNPMALWEIEKFVKTGTLFFHDKISQTNVSLGYRPASRPDVTDLRSYLSKADVSVFRELPTIARAKATVVSDVVLPFEPSDILLNSHAWNGRSGHQLDSTLLLWNKKRQPRATTLLASFVSLNEVERPPSYGAKELFFVACELAETQYAFSDFGVGAAGSDLKDHGEEKSVLCGQVAQFYPVKAQDESEGRLLFLSSDSIMTYNPSSQPMYYSKARAAAFYPGSFKDWELPPDCPFDVTGVLFSTAQIQRVLLRQRLHDIAVEWERNALMGESESEQTQADDLVNTKLEAILKKLADGSSFQETSAVPVVDPFAGVTPATSIPASQDIWTELVKSAKERVEVETRMETRLIHSLHTVSQDTSVQRGIVLPLYDKITTLGVSLILQLRSLGVDLPIEIPHCGDFDEDYGETIMEKREQLGEVYVYNACKRAVTAKSLLGPKPLFCKDLDSCHRTFRNFAIKILGVVYSRFEEIMLIDADALLFQTPMTLWETNKYKTTGTLFFNDRIAEANFSMGLGYKPAKRPNIMAIEDYLSKANVDLFRHLPTLSRPNVSAEVIAADKSTVTLHFQPSEGLLKSHPWNGRSAHRVDSSILLWNKKRQPRATAILASFISLNDMPRPPSYGDKELFFVACEMAESQYAFSDFATGSAGADFRDHGANKSIICGSAAHHFPEKSEATPIQEVSLLYMNTDYIMRYKPKKSPMYYSAARPRDFFPGTFEEKKLLMMCPFDISGVKFTDAEVKQVYHRQQVFDIATEWEQNFKDINATEREAVDSLTNEKLAALSKNGPSLVDRTDPPKDPKKEEEEKKAAEKQKKAAEVKKNTDELQLQEKQLVLTLNQLAQQTSVKRGIIIPVYDGIIKLAISLVLELRTMGIMEPIEMPHCGDLNPDVQMMYLTKKQLGTIWFYNVCERAARATSVLDSNRKVFCQKIEDCHAKFRGFIIKPLALTFSRFEEVMMIDADTTFFVSPAKLWDSKKYNTTGNFLMHDRISHEKWFMAERVPGNPNLSVEQSYFSKFDLSPFRLLPTLERPKATVKNPSSVTLNFEPSEFLLRSHSFNVRAGHQVDSSLVLWNKKRHPRATAILASFVALNDIVSPPSYGDKELFFYASELAETLYSFSDHAISAVGTKLTDGGPKNSTLCGDMAQIFPIHEDGVADDDVPLFYFNSDRILWFRPKTEPVYYMKARPWEFYPGAFGERRQECPFDITVGKLSDDEERHLAGRQHLYEVVDAWDRIAKEKPANIDEQNASTDEVLRKRIAEMQGKNLADVAPSPPRENKMNDQLERTKQMMEEQLVYTLSQITQLTTTKRGIVMPLYEPIARLGFSLILELRAMNVTLPIEVPYCTDLKPETVELIRTKQELGEVRAYDVCELAVKAKSVTNSSRPVFCADIAGCHTKFRSFMIKPLAVTYSQFEEILMLDADTTFFVNPTVLFDSDKFKTTGNLLMHDRISHDWWFMAQHVAVKGKPDVSVEQKYFADFDVTPFRPLPTLNRPKATLENKTPVKLGFEPSDFLLSSHSFNLRSGHQVDSSLVMWDKKRHPRATAILASFVAQNDIASPPSYGDKELFFYASELAETLYSFSDHAIGAVGTKVEDGGPKNSTLCGDMAQIFPIHYDGVADDDVPLFYLNSDRILHFKPDVEPVYYMKARPWEYYPGAFGNRPQECPFNISVGRFVEPHIKHLAERRKFSEQVKAW